MDPQASDSLLEAPPPSAPQNQARYSAGVTAVEPDDAATLAQAGETRCFLSFRGETATGPHQGVVYEGIVGLVIGADGAVDEGYLQGQDGQRRSLVGQVTGRSLRLWIMLDGDEALAVTGSGADEAEVCFGAFAGAFSGPDLEDIGTWTATGLGAG